jgi:hypothetical protein
MLIGCDHAPTTTGNTSHGWQRCSITGLGQYKDEKEKSSLPDFFQFFHLWLTPSLFGFSMQCIAWEAAEMAELREEVTQAQAAVVMARAHAAQAEGTTREKDVLLATIHGEAAKVTQRDSTLGDELVTACWVQDVAEEIVPALALSADRDIG